METNKSEVFTVEDWYDGPLLGLAEYNGQTCVYRRVGEIEYDDSQDDLEQHRDCSQAASGIYKLTPISDDEKEQILSEWAIWCESVATKSHKAYYLEHDIKSTLKLQGVTKGVDDKAIEAYLADWHYCTD